MVFKDLLLVLNLAVLRQRLMSIEQIHEYLIGITGQ